MNDQSISKQDIRRGSVAWRAGKTSQNVPLRMESRLQPVGDRGFKAITIPTVHCARISPGRLKAGLHTGKSRAFTLMDLLAVVATVAILGVLMLPAFGRTKHQSNDAICKNNLRQLTMGCLLYADESRGVMPWAPLNNDSGSRGSMETLYFASGGPGVALNPASPPSEAVWAMHLSDDSFSIHAEVGAVFPYVTGQKRADQLRLSNKTAYEVYRCPSTGVPGQVLRVNYSESKYFTPGATTVPISGTAGVATSAIVNPANKVLLVEEPVNSMRECGFGVPSGGVQAAAIVSSTRHSIQNNFSYSDGHVDSVSLAQNKRMLGLGNVPLATCITRWWDPLGRE